MRPYLMFKNIDAWPWTVGQGKGQVIGRLRGSTKGAILDAKFEMHDGLYQSFAFERLEGSVHFEHEQVHIVAQLHDGSSSLRAEANITSGTKGNLQDLRSPFLELDWLSKLPDMDVLVESSDYSLPRVADQFGSSLEACT